jgi:lipoprotein-anchoring transpeptidase ErfK/SrfK
MAVIGTGAVVKRNLSRRNFIKLTGYGMGGLFLNPFLPKYPLIEFPNYDRLGRVCVGKVEIKNRPDESSDSVGVLYEDAVVPWLKEVVGPKPYYINQRWVETPDGFIYAPYLQPVKNIPNQPVQDLAQTDIGPGLWMEITIPYADVILENDPSSNSWVKAKIDQGLPVRLYYQQVFWVDRIKTDEAGQKYYRVNPNYYGGVDMLWVKAEAMRAVTPEEIQPISPEVEEKRIVVDVVEQSLSCFEKDVEVYYCRVSTGAKFDAYGNAVDKWSTPVGKHLISRKFLTLQMSGGTTGAGYDLPGIAWTTIFVTGGVAIHSTFWHNDYGVPRSHGCVNLAPDDAKWVFLWTQPTVSYQTGMVDVSITGEVSTPVEVVED